MIIQNQSQLNDICTQLAKKSYLTIDTEFLRDKTYYSKLCLVQLAAEGIDPVALDPIATNLDWAPFYELMQNENVIKVFHAARQDLEIFFQESGEIPTPIFDTQVAAMVCGYGDSIAYAKLVADLTDGQIAKNAQFTDWKNKDALSRIRGVPANITKGKYGPIIFDLVKDALNSPKNKWPVPQKHVPLPNELSPLLEMLKLLLKINCSENNVAPKLIANNKDLEKVALGENEDVLCMKGWRFEIFGQDALALKEGKISLGLKDNKIHKFEV